MTELETFVDTLFARTQAPRFVCSFANERAQAQHFPPRQLVTRDVKRICEFAREWDLPGRALYVCVATLLPGHTRRAKANLSQLVCLHADLDFKGIAASRADIEDVLKLLPCQPNLVVFSGHGLHAYWLLTDPLPAVPENIARLEWLLRKLAHVVAGDPAVCEAARVMRLPGTHNSKNGAWHEVKIVSCHKGHYALERLEDWLKRAPVMLPRVERKTSGSGSDSRNGSASDPFMQLGEEQCVRAPIDVEQRLEEMTYHAPDGTSIHNTQLSVSAALLKRGHSIDDVVERVIAATREAAGREGFGWDWAAERKAVRAMCVKWIEKHPVAVCDEEDFEARHVLEEIDFEAGHFIDEE
jgi:hypothetical protein